MFAYQPATKPPTKETVEKVKTAVLSTTAKVTARAKAKEAEQTKTEAMETDDKATEEKTAETTDDAEMKVDEAAGSDDKRKEQTKRKAPEPSSSRLENLSRVTPAQLQYISFPSDSRYVPVRPVNSGSAPAPSASSRSAPPVGFGGGILLMRDTKPDEVAEFHELEVFKAIDTNAAGAAAPTEGVGAQAAAGGDDADLLTGPIADPPAPFEWTDWGSD